MDNGRQRRLNSREYSDVVAVLDNFPDLTPSVLEDSVYSGVEKRLDEER